MCESMYILTYVCVYICICIHTHTHIYICVVCMYTYVCVCVSRWTLAHQLTIGLLFAIRSNHRRGVLFCYFVCPLQFTLALAPQGFIVHCPLSGACPSYPRCFVSLLCPGLQHINLHCPVKYCCILNCEMSSSRGFRTRSPWNIKF
jgi:hypothetical protein